MLRSRPSLTLVLCLIGSAVAHFLGEFPPVVETPWRKILLPCSCHNATLDCSERGKTHLTSEDLCEERVDTLDLFDNAFAFFPDGFSAVTMVNASRNRLETVPQASQLNVGVKMLDLSDNRISNINTELRGLASLQNLRLSKNNGLKHLRYLPDSCSLVNLEVAGNKIGNLGGPFRRCTQLQTLDLSDNRLTLLPEDIFSSLIELRMLDLSWNQVAPLAPRIFATLTRLTELRLDGTELIMLPEGIFDNLVQLTFLSLDGNTLMSMSTPVFSALQRLSYLSITGSQLQTLPENGFGNLTSLEELHLASNDLSALPNSFFSPLQGLKMINLEFNKLSTIPTNIFSGLLHLDTIFLKENELLPSLPPELLSRLPRLQLISLSLREFHHQFLQELAYVPYVQCVRCGATSLSSRAFSSLPRLEGLAFESNIIESVADDAFAGLPLLSFLSLGSNGITALPVQVFSPLVNLTRLHLWNNSLTMLSENVFSSLFRVTELTLNQNALSDLPERIFQDLRSLKRLDLSYNSLTVLPPRLFANLTFLWELNVANNHLSSLPAYDSTCFSLRAISFERNAFTTLDETALRSWLRSSGGDLFLNVADNSTRLQPDAALWIRREPGVTIGRADNCSGEWVRSGRTLVHYHLKNVCDSRPS